MEIKVFFRVFTDMSFKAENFFIVRYFTVFFENFVKILLKMNFLDYRSFEKYRFPRYTKEKISRCMCIFNLKKN